MSKSQSKPDISHSQQTEPSPGDPLRAGFAMWAQATRDQVARMNALGDELADLENRAYTRGRQAFEQAEQLQRELTDYATALGVEWRRMILEATRRTADLWSSATV